jgi:transcriptional regulator with PAS, ATPase and Fis domain
MKRFLDVVARVADATAPLFITGETGVGKERLARAIHAESSRSERPFVAVNCAALPEQLLESELFGHEKGSFTGADARRPGRFEQAAGGTIFLDEIGEMPTHLQVKLLNVLQRGEVQRIGAAAPLRVDARVMAATNRDVTSEVEAGTFREDLYYRLNVVPLEIPALRERREDIGILVPHFLKVHTPSGLKPKQMTPAALRVLEGYEWPGNIRELENEVKRLIAVAGDVIHEEDVSDPVKRGPRGVAGYEGQPGEVRNLDDLVAQVEVSEIRRAMLLTDGNKTRAADMLGISRFTLQRKMEKYNIG